MTAAVQTGLERLVADRAGLVQGRRIGLLANQASVSATLQHAIDLLQPAGLVALFGPEHGLRGEAQDMESSASGRDNDSGLPVHSLYGCDAGSLRPAPESLADLDVVVCDLQDVGARYYTFAATLFHVMEAAAEAGVQVVVADRPNPLGGMVVEGPGLDDGYASFVGRLDVPVRHGLTMGEMAGLFRSRSGLDLDLQVVPMAGWRRDMSWGETGLPWVAPSPNMPTLRTATVYPGACLVEGTVLSEGRGTTRPFEFTGAPWLRAAELAAAMNRLQHPGLVWRAHWFKPVAQKWAGRVCAGVQAHVAHPPAVRSFAAYVDLLSAMRRQDPERFAWRREAYEFVTDIPAIDLLAGSARLRTALEGGGSAADLQAEWEAGVERFRGDRRAFLLYAEPA